VVVGGPSLTATGFDSGPSTGAPHHFDRAWPDSAPAGLSAHRARLVRSRISWCGVDAGLGITAAGTAPTRRLGVSGVRFAPAGCRRPRI